MFCLKSIIYRISTVALLLVLLAGKGTAQSREKFRYFPSVVNEGQDLRIVYHPDVNGAAITGSVYLFKNYAWEGHDITLTKTDTGYISTYKIPEGTALIAYRFWVGDTVDVGIKFPYGLMVHTKDGKSMMPGAFAEWGLFRERGYDGEMLPFVSPQSELPAKYLVQLWIAREYNQLDVRRKLFFDMARGIRNGMPQPQADSIIAKGAQELLALKDLNERDLLQIEQTYRMVLNNRKNADSVKVLALTRYPDGMRKRFTYIDSIYMGSKIEVRVAALKTLFAKYPVNTYPYDDYLNPALTDTKAFINGFTGILNGLFFGKQYAEFKDIVKLAPYRLLNYYYDHFVDYPMRPSKALISEQQQLDFSNAIIAIIMERAAGADAGFSGRGFLTQSEWKRTVISAHKRQISFHANLLFKAGKFAEAKKYALMVKPYMAMENISFNALYTNLLEHDHASAQSEQYIIDAVKADTASPEMVELLKNYYTKKNGKAAGFEEYYAALLPPAKVAAFHERLNKAMIKLPAPMFTLKNMQGQTVDLSAQKGKTIVLDFWASWCYPCKAAMPGMETLVKKYKDDPNVEFYFISTLEETPNYKQLVEKFIKDKKYDFNVLYDDQKITEHERSGVVFDSYAKLLHLNGIPQKVIIDPKGNIRWTADGFSGDLVNLTREVDYIISAIKNDKAE